MTPLAPVPRYWLSVPDRQPPSPPKDTTCQHPSCRKSPVHRHHIVARSFIHGAYDYVQIAEPGREPMVVRNVADLCYEHHEQLESQWGGCQARLRWAGGTWVWYRRWKGTDLENEHIWWTDAIGTAWILVGFMKGDEWKAPLLTTKPS